jgi:hypothetical protein
MPQGSKGAEFPYGNLRRLIAERVKPGAEAEIEAAFSGRKMHKKLKNWQTLVGVGFSGLPVNLI